MSQNPELRILALGIVGFFLCQIFAPAAFVEGNRYARWCEATGTTAGLPCHVGRIFGFFGSLLLMLPAATIVIGGVVIVDDSYNANPLSTIAAADFLASLPGESWLVLGDMKELGDDAARLHREVGEAARASGVSRLFAYGDLASSAAEGFGENARWYASVDALVDELGDGLSADVTVLVKGSRSMRMERVVDALLEPEDVRLEA